MMHSVEISANIRVIRVLFFLIWMKSLLTDIMVARNVPKCGQDVRAPGESFFCQQRFNIRLKG